MIRWACCPVALRPEHVVNGVLIEEATALEEPEDPALEYGCKGAGVVGREARGLVVAHPRRRLGENAVEYEDTEVEVGALTPRDMRRAGTPG
jgi:hypothetical protein